MEEKRQMNMEEILNRLDNLYTENRGTEAELFLCASIQEAAQLGDEDAMLSLLNELLGYYRETSQVENSYRIADQALELAERMGLKDTIPYATTILNVANAYRAGGRLSDSLDCYAKVAKIYERELAPDSMLVASMENNRSLLCQEMGDYEQARECLLRALEIVQAKAAEFEIAVTKSNLSVTCMQLGMMEEAGKYAEESIAEFRAIRVEDAHYGASLAAMGNYLFHRGEYREAKKYFAEAREITERSLGQNDYFRRLGNNIRACEERMEAEAPLKGLALSRAYYEAFGEPMIREKFPEYADRIAVGLVGEGSDCFGYDDEISRDHDWGPDFCLWVSRETFDQIGQELVRAYRNLPAEFGGYKRNVTPQGAHRRGVLIIEEFYGRLLLTPWKRDDEKLSAPERAAAYLETLDFARIPDPALAAAVNGEVFRDEEGLFTAVREGLQKGYPEELLYRKLTEAAVSFGQTGQYNFVRCLQRGDRLTARLMLTECIRSAMRLKHYLEGSYPLHDKWLLLSTAELPGGERLADLLRKLAEMELPAGEELSNLNRTGQPALGTTAPLIEATVEEIAVLLAEDLYGKHYISDRDPFLAAHMEELMAKSALAALDREKLIDRIVKMEFEAFDKVQNAEGRAECQNNWPTFYVMRKSQYLTWNRTMLLQYGYEFRREYEKGRNLIEEKYGRMMESTAPAEYEAIKHHFPALSDEKKAIIDQVAKIQVEWMEIFAQKYPRLAGNSRSIHQTEDNLYNTSFETYLRGEAGTYSDKMLELYGRFIVGLARENKNLSYETVGHTVRMYGYESMDEAEEVLANTNPRPW